MRSPSIMPDVVKLADQNFVMVKVDLTQKGNPVYARLLGRYGIKGVPTVVFLDGRGKERRTCGWWIICRRSRCSPVWRHWLRNKSSKEIKNAESEIFRERTLRETLTAVAGDTAQVGREI